MKSRLQSGINTPRTGYRFIDDGEWSVLCEHFLDLMDRAIKARTTDDEAGHPRVEARNDDGGTVMTRRKARRNQSRFRLNMMELYDSACAISGEGVVEVLEAAHIVSHSETGLNHCFGSITALRNWLPKGGRSTEGALHNNHELYRISPAIIINRGSHG